MAESTTVVARGFEWRNTVNGRVLRSSALSGVADHLFTTRDQTPAGVHEPDYDLIGAALGVSSRSVVRVRQVHGCDVFVATADDVSEGTEADAIVTADPQLAVSVRVADCVPVLVADHRQRAVAAVHAGWRGTAAGAVVAAVEALDRLDVHASDLLVAIGPSIGPCCYQVDAAVREAFAARHPGADAWFTPDGRDRWRLDLWRANRALLEACGVPASSIEVASACTADRPDVWYSHRRQGSAAGRMVAAIRIGGRRDHAAAGEGVRT